MRESKFQQEIAVKVSNKKIENSSASSEIKKGLIARDMTMNVNVNINDSGNGGGGDTMIIKSPKKATRLSLRNKNTVITTTATTTDKENLDKCKLSLRHTDAISNTNTNNVILEL